MSWNYRLCKFTFVPDEEDIYEIREAYCNEDGSVWAVTENAVGVSGESVESVRLFYERMALAFQKEVIDLDTFVFAKRDGVEDETDLTQIEQDDFDEFSKGLE